MQGDVEETVGIAGRRLSRSLLEAEIVLRCAAWVTGIQGAMLLGLGMLTKGLQFRILFLSDRIVCILGGVALLGVSALVLHRRGRWAVFSVAVLQLLCTLFFTCVFIAMMGAVVDLMGRALADMFGSGPEVPEKDAVDLFLTEVRSFKLDRETLPLLCFVMLTILLPLFVGCAVLGRAAKEAFSPSLRGNPLAPISTCRRSRASVRVWAAVGVVGLSLVHLAMVLLGLLWIASRSR